MRISVIIPTHNRADALQRTLAALGEQTLERSEFEVIVVDDGSTDETRRAIRRLRPPFGYRLVEKDQGGLASARNRGAQEAQGEILLFLDDDVVPERDTVAQHLAAHDGAGEAVAVVGSLPYPPHVELNSFLWYLEQSGHYDLYKHPDKYPEGRPPMPPMNGNSSLPRETFVEIGRYDELFKAYGSEDLDLGYRLDRAGVRFVYNPAAIGYHDHIKTFAQFCTDMETAGRSLIGLYRRYPEIREAKKIDILEDPIGKLPPKKQLYKAVLMVSTGMPAVLALPRLIVRVFGPVYALRRLLFPFYRWLGHYHYAVGMRRGLAAAE